jgi:GTPase
MLKAHMKATDPSQPRERALLVQVVLGRRDRREAEDSLAELERLADSAGAATIGCITQRRDRPTPGLFVGEGKLVDIQLACREGKANVVIFDNELSAVQVNNLDLALGIKVIDRTEVILQIFARRARSAEAKVQVELAQLQYLISRIPVSRKQQRFQGGIGMRGPGESPLQLRNAPMRRRISDLKRRLDRIGKRHASVRKRRPWPLVSLVGYTNAGKSTLLNACTQAGAYVDDRLFATLDTKTRLVHVPENRKLLLTDTVGFIRHLPHGLVASFRSTLDVARESDLLLLIADAADPGIATQIDVVHETLAEIEAEAVPYMIVLNKSDAATQDQLDHLLAIHHDAVVVSARKGEGLDKLKARIVEELLAHDVHFPGENDHG